MPANGWPAARRRPRRSAAKPVRNFALAIATKDRKDDVRLSTALHKLTEEDRGAAMGAGRGDARDPAAGASTTSISRSRSTGCGGATASPSIRRQPAIGYKESIRKTVTQRGRHKKQSGGHGQFGDCVIEVKPLPRGEGFKFNDKISGGVVPKQWIPAVEDGVRDALVKGPLGFPVVDVAVTLIDGSYHSVDSSELAFRTAGRIGMSEALAQAAPHLLEPVMKVTVVAPSGATSRVTSAIASRGAGRCSAWTRARAGRAGTRSRR